jgi:6-phosphogluconate dehydrogenase
MIGLGKMGGNMSRRLLQAGHEVVVHDRSAEAMAALAEVGAEPAASLAEVADKLSAPRVVWIMVPSGGPTQSVVEGLAEVLAEGDLVVDGGNSHFPRTVARGDMLAQRGIRMVDVGTSGGVWGLEGGYSMMVGGEDEAVALLRPALETLAPGADKGWGHVGPRGAGHYVKMVHNGIEYGIMQAYAEGFHIMEASEYELDLHQVSEIWRYGSVVRSWLLDLIARALEDDVELSDLAAYVPDSGEGRWTVQEAIDRDVPAPVITLALQARLRSRVQDSYADKLLSAMRNQFGGHATKKKGD